VALWRHHLVVKGPLCSLCSLLGACVEIVEVSGVLHDVLSDILSMKGEMSVIIMV
jgi:hypothetical protein